MDERKKIALRALMVINNILERDGVTKTSLGEQLGCKPSKFTEILGGRMLVPTEMLGLLCDKFSVSADWLLTGDGDMFKVEGRPVDSIPLLPFEAFAGPGLPTYSDLSIDDYYTVSEFKHSDFLIRVKGDSMYPKFSGGDIVACKQVKQSPSEAFFQWGRIYVINTESQGVMIKRIQPSEREDCIKCVSDNEKYAPFDVPKSDIVALALVNGSISLE